jgi:hypothetical protein
MNVIVKAVLRAQHPRQQGLVLIYIGRRSVSTTGSFMKYALLIGVSSRQTLILSDR